MKKLFIIFAVLCLAVPAVAADWNFYGSARFATFWVDEDDDLGLLTSEDEGLQWVQQGNSRIGATVQLNDQIGGAFEMSDSFGKRKLYGTYTFGGGSELLLGQTYTPSALFYSNSVYDGDGDLLGIGEFYEGRLPMIQWKMGGLKIALISPNTSDYVASEATTVTVSGLDDAGNPINVEIPGDDAVDYDVDVTIPKIEVGYGYKADMWYFDVFAGYQTFEIDGEGTGIAGLGNIDVDSYLIGGGVGANLGAFFVKVGAHYGQNLGNYGSYSPSFRDDSADSAVINAAGTDVDDSDGLGYLAVIGFNLSEMFTFEAGYGHEEAEVDNTNNTLEADQWYVNATINIAPGFFIVPEVGMATNSQDNTNAEPETFYAGAKWQINF